MEPHPRPQKQLESLAAPEHRNPIVVTDYPDFVKEFAGIMFLDMNRVKAYLELYELQDSGELTKFVGIRPDAPQVILDLNLDRPLTNQLNPVNTHLLITSDIIAHPPSQDWLTAVKEAPEAYKDLSLDIVNATELLGRAAKLNVIENNLSLPFKVRSNNQLEGLTTKAQIREATERLTGKVSLPKLEKALVGISLGVLALTACASLLSQGGTSQGNGGQTVIGATPEGQPPTPIIAPPPTPKPTHIAPPTSLPTLEAGSAFCGLNTEQIIAQEGISDYNTVPVLSIGGFEEVFGLNPEKVEPNSPESKVLEQVLEQLTLTVANDVLKIADSQWKDVNVDKVIIPEYVNARDIETSVEETLGDEQNPFELPFELVNYEPGNNIKDDKTLLVSVQAGESWTTAVWNNASIGTEDGRSTVNGTLLMFDEDGERRLLPVPAQFVPDNSHAAIVIVDSCEPNIVKILGPGGDPIAVLDEGADPDDINSLWNPLSVQVITAPQETEEASQIEPTPPINKQNLEIVDLNNYSVPTKQEMVALLNSATRATDFNGRIVPLGVGTEEEFLGAKRITVEAVGWGAPLLIKHEFINKIINTEGKEEITVESKILVVAPVIIPSGINDLNEPNFALVILGERDKTDVGITPHLGRITVGLGEDAKNYLANEEVLSPLFDPMGKQIRIKLFVEITDSQIVGDVKKSENPNGLFNLLLIENLSNPVKEYLRKIKAKQSITTETALLGPTVDLTFIEETFP